MIPMLSHLHFMLQHLIVFGLWKKNVLSTLKLMCGAFVIEDHDTAPDVISISVKEHIFLFL